MFDYRNDEGKWLDYHQFRSPQQALRQLMQYVEFGEDNDGQIVIYTTLTFKSAGFGLSGTERRRVSWQTGQRGR